MDHGLIGILHNVPLAPGSAFSEASRDVLDQVEAIEKALGELGRPAVRVPFSRDPGEPVKAIRDRNVMMVFNLCETVDEDPRLCGHPAAVLELVGIPFSGSPSSALTLSTDKWVAKQLLDAAGIPTPAYVLHGSTSPLESVGLRYPVIVKPRFEDASIGIDQDSIFRDEGELRGGILSFSRRFGDVLIEEYIDGREFNVSAFGYPNAFVLPVAEIDFSGFPDDLYRIVGYRAKWKRDSVEFRHTLRVFPETLKPSVASEIEKLTARCFNLFMLRDYGRIDFRMDGRGNVYVLEVNANPCLSPDAGFAAAMERSGINYRSMVDQLVSFMVLRNGRIDRSITTPPR
ncbi:MAG: hypothetical protein HY788_18875 [Deltaproteobacteria bacterium]|nr:hypothetical protein [Deltaproteobacteria bacterium]